jgi:hypothetical protein
MSWKLIVILIFCATYISPAFLCRFGETVLPDKHKTLHKSH